MKSIKILMMAVAIGLAISSLTSSIATAASHEKHATVIVKDAWARARTARAKTGVVYMTVHNMGREDDRLVAATSAVSAKATIHTAKMIDGVMKMRHAKEGIEVKAGGMVELKPGSYHVMLLGLKGPVAEGAKFPITLVFKKAGDVEVMVSVKKAGAMSGTSHGKMEHDKDHGTMKKMN